MVVGSGWRQLSTRITILLAILVALLSLATGIANISYQTVSGPLAAVIPLAVQRTAGFTGALTGFLMLAAALGLRRGLRLAWYLTIVLLPMTVIQGLVQSSPLSVPLIVLSALAFPNLIANRQRFDRSLSLSTSQLAAGAAIVGAQIYGTVGTYALREHFSSVTTLVDAFYYTLVTASTVGYGDATPQTQVARLFGMSVVVVGTASFAIALGSLLGPAIEARFERALGRATDARIDLLEDHILVLGYGDLTETVLEELHGTNDYLVVTTDTDRAATLQDEESTVLVGDPSDETTLERARIGDAEAVLVATNNDAQDALSVLTARQLNPDVRIAAAATERENVPKLRVAGADTVISPAVIGGRLVVRSALSGDRPSIVEQMRSTEADEGVQG
ncbi:MAG: NAD-binding protein [Halobacteriales archaeon]|nr:NAD-binding protein [Halobacteriales archaeon]